MNQNIFKIFSLAKCEHWISEGFRHKAVCSSCQSNCLITVAPHIIQEQRKHILIDIEMFMPSESTTW